MAVKKYNRFYAAATLIILIWAFSLFQFTWLGADLLPKLLPRSLSGLPGILTVPFIHGDFLHLISNSLPLIVFAALISIYGNKYFIKVTVCIIIMSGIMLWLMGRGAYHVGASGLIFGYFGFLLVRMFYAPSMMSITISIGVFIFYGGIIWGVLPQGGGISWEGHLFGFIAGAVLAKIIKPKVTA